MTLWFVAIRAFLGYLGALIVLLLIYLVNLSLVIGGSVFIAYYALRFLGVL